MKIVLALLFITVHAAAVIQSANGEVSCTNGTVQLVEGPNEYEGRVEFCSNRGWAQVCGSGTWGQIPASLVCLQRSSSQSFNTIVTSGYYGVDNLTMNSVNIRQTRCIPSGSFSDCVNMEIQNQGCSGGLLASVACPANCEGKSLRLISDSQRPAEGLVEVCHEVDRIIRFWAGVCHENFTLATATVVCRQLGLLRNDSSVTISHSSTKHWYTYDTLRCIGNESNVSKCQLDGDKKGAGCSSVIVNCQGVDSTTLPSPEGATGSEFSTSTASSVTMGNTPTSQEPNLTSSQPSSDMLIIITGTVCGIIILLLLIAVTMLTLILVTKSRNSKRRLNDAVPTTVNGSQRQSNTLDSRTPMYSPNYIQTPSDQPPSSQSSTLKKLTINTTSTSMYAEPTNNTIQTVPLPIPIESYSCSYPVNNPQRDSGIILPQSDTFLLLPEIDPADVHIYAEPDEPGFNSQGHEYAELEACVDRYQNSTALHVAGPLPYEVPKVVGGSCVNVTVPEPTDTHTRSQIPTEGSLECQNVTCDHPYATPGLPS